MRKSGVRFYCCNQGNRKGMLEFLPYKQRYEVQGANDWHGKEERTREFRIRGV